MKRSYFYFIFLVLAVAPFLVAGCASNPPVEIKAVQKSAPAPVAETKKEIIFPSHNKAVAAPVTKGDIKHAKMEAAAALIAIMKEECKWEKPLSYYGEKVVVETKIVNGFVFARAHMDSSLCPEKN